MPPGKRVFGKFARHLGEKRWFPGVSPWGVPSEKYRNNRGCSFFPEGKRTRSFSQFRFPGRLKSKLLGEFHSWTKVVSPQRNYREPGNILYHSSFNFRICYKKILSRNSWFRRFFTFQSQDWLNKNSLAGFWFISIKKSSKTMSSQCFPRKSDENHIKKPFLAQKNYHHSTPGSAERNSFAKNQFKTQ